MLMSLKTLYKMQLVAQRSLLHSLDLMQVIGLTIINYVHFSLFESNSKVTVPRELWLNV